MEVSKTPLTNRSLNGLVRGSVHESVEGNEGDDGSHFEINNSAQTENQPESDCDDSPIHAGPSPQPELTVYISSLCWLLAVLTIEQIQTSYTTLEPSTRSDEDEAPQSVIHAPPGFHDFVRAPTSVSHIS